MAPVKGITVKLRQINVEGSHTGGDGAVGRAVGGRSGMGRWRGCGDGFMHPCDTFMEGEIEILEFWSVWAGDDGGTEGSEIGVDSLKVLFDFRSDIVPDGKEGVQASTKSQAVDVGLNQGNQSL